MRKTRLLLAVLVCLLLACTAVLLSCGEEHTHTFEGAWSSDASSHWHKATCEHEGEKADLADHDFDEGEVTAEPTESEDGVRTHTCTVCGYKKEVAVPALEHVHTYADTLSYDENGHYYAATCGHADAKKDYTAHSHTTAVTAPTCTLYLCVRPHLQGPANGCHRP